MKFIKKNNIIVQKVELNTYEIDRLNLKIEAKNQSIKYLEDENIKLKHILDSKENFGLNCLLLTYEELIDILKNKYHWLNSYINRWFELDEDCKYENGIYNEDNYELYFGEDAIEVEQDAYWLVHIKNDYAICFKDITKLNRKIYELEK